MAGSQKECFTSAVAWSVGCSLERQIHGRTTRSAVGLAGRAEGLVADRRCQPDGQYYDGYGDRDRESQGEPLACRAVVETRVLTGVVLKHGAFLPRWVTTGVWCKWLSYRMTAGHSPKRTLHSLLIIPYFKHNHNYYHRLQKKCCQRSLTAV